MNIMSAGVHDARFLAPVLDLFFILDKKSINVGPDSDANVGQIGSERLISDHSKAFWAKFDLEPNVA